MTTSVSASGGTLRSTPRLQEFTDGRIIAYTVYPMPDGGGMATHEDITEREELNARLKRQYELGKEQEETLRFRNFQFDTAINNMSQGLCFFDADHRLIVCNDRFVEMYGIPSDRVSPGTRWRKSSICASKPAAFPAMSRDEYLRWRTNVAVSAEAKRQHRRAEERPHLQDPSPADAGRRLGCHARGHHRAAASRRS